MFQKKSLLPVICLSACLCGGMVSVTSALEMPTPYSHSDGVPYLLYIQDARCTLKISNKTASIYGMVNGQVGIVDNCKIEVFLQEKSGRSWKNIATWTDESDGLRASVSKSKSVTAGKTYRAKAVVTAWSGSDSESETIYSSEETA